MHYRKYGTFLGFACIGNLIVFADKILKQNVVKLIYDKCLIFNLELFILKC